MSSILPGFLVLQLSKVYQIITSKIFRNDDTKMIQVLMIQPFLDQKFKSLDNVHMASDLSSKIRGSFKNF